MTRLTKREEDLIDKLLTSIEYFEALWGEKLLKKGETTSLEELVERFKAIQKKHEGCGHA